MSDTKTERDFIDELQARGFGVVEDGTAVIVCGKASEIPIDRPVGVFDLMDTTRARRFESAKTAAMALIKSDTKENHANDYHQPSDRC